jgi:bifunctional non-homologous end joining protein LigD
MRDILPSLQAMPLRDLPEPFDDQDWIYEIKFDGFRALAYFFGDKCQLVSRNGNVHSSRAFTEVGSGIAQHLKTKNAVLDGELCCLGGDEKPIFSPMMSRKLPVYFYAFDLLWLNGKDLRQKPLFERNAKLRWLIPDQLGPLLYLDHVEGEGVKLFEEVCRLDMEGIVAKRKDGIYTADVTRTTWLKIKNQNYSRIEGRFERPKSVT